ncbi:hypothetical protein SASPL_138099 [Salvia splendens]|uniref:Fungal lipase-type domain-containing protein n=1 Tax=Salvia splendens TaxID=180675 RepID=A0A8X8ZE26_SALSN|nr:hypothetical protein SASPL_138099 [Salvia splendens]
MSSSSCNKSFCTHYMLLNPKAAELGDVVKILFSSDIGKRKFIDCSNGTQEPLDRRWIICFSILFQKFLHANAKPLADFGNGVEHWLNLLSRNEGFLGLINNTFKGKVIQPDKTSASFTSFIGNLDKRFELDPAIGFGDKRYHAALSVMASKAAYENNNFIRALVDDRWKIPGIGKMHGGFMKALGLLKSQGWPQEQDPKLPETAYYAIRKHLKKLMQQNEKTKFIVTGHNLGGALALLFPAILGLHGDSFLLNRLEGVYTFGQPRVGDEEFGKYMTKLINKYTFRYVRFVYSYDVVPRLPCDNDTFMFKHFGACIYFNSLYKGKYVKGREYEEGGLLRLFRVIGVMVAGVPAHCPQDYVNSMRLGLSEMLLSLHTHKMISIH